jgi:hypothetical protein
VFDNCRRAIENTRVHPVLQQVAHRPWPVPTSPWIMHQTWLDLLFAHWPIPHEQLRSRVPPELPLDTFDGQCWLGIAPFQMRNVRARMVPPLPCISAFAELNVRTYTTVDGKPGVYFFSLDAASRLAVQAARAFYHLPYFSATMQVTSKGNAVDYHSRRRDGDAEFQASYGPVAPVERRSPGTLEHWLTERYCLYTVAHRRVYRGEIHHVPWPLQDAQAQIAINTMASAAGIVLPETAPLLHFARRLDVLIWPLERL